MHRTAVKKVVFEESSTPTTRSPRPTGRSSTRPARTSQKDDELPGAGKTALLEHTLGMRGKLRLGILEGDVQTTLDADRLARFHVRWCR